jgi:hypothetical protein
LENLQIFLSTTNWCGRRFAPGGGPSLITFEIYIYNRLKDRQGIRQYIIYYILCGVGKWVKYQYAKSQYNFIGSIYNYVHWFSIIVFIQTIYFYIGEPSNNSIYNYVHWFYTIVFIQTIYFYIGEPSNNSIYNYVHWFTGSIQLFLFRQFIFILENLQTILYTIMFMDSLVLYNCFYKDNWRTFKYFYLPQTGVAVASLRGAGRL